MSSRRTAQIAAVLVLVAAVTVRAQDKRDENADRQPGGVPTTAAPRIVAPADPSSVKGRWTIGDATHQITAGDFYELHQLLQKLEGSAQVGVSEPQVWEYLLASNEADSYGLLVTEAELDRALERDDPDVFEGTVARWKAQGVTLEQGIDYTRRNAAIHKLRDLIVNNSRITTHDAFDQYKAQHLQYKVEYVRFAATEHEPALIAEGIDDEKLRTFWNENRAVPQRFRVPAVLTVEILSLDPSRFEKGSIAGDKAARITRERALEYFRANRATLMAQVPPDKQHLLQFDEKTPIDRIVSPFEVLEDTIRKSLVLEEMLHRGLDDARLDGADWSAVAAKHGLIYAKVENCDRARSLTELRDYGLNVFATFFAAEPGAISEVQSNQQVRFVFRLVSKRDSRIPEFDEIKDQVRGAYLETVGGDRARAAATEILDAMAAATMAELGDIEVQLTREADEAAERRIQELGITRQQDQNRERMRARGQIRPRIEEAKRKGMPKHFDAWLAKNPGRLRSTDYFEFEVLRPDRMPTDVATDEAAFLRSNYYIRSLQVGEMVPMLLEDHASRAFFLARLADRRDPPISDMTPLDLMQARARVAQSRETELANALRYPGLAERLQLELPKTTEKENDR